MPLSFCSCYGIRRGDVVLSKCRFGYLGERDRDMLCHNKRYREQDIYPYEDGRRMGLLL